MAYKIQWECCCEDRCCDKKKKDIEIKAWTCIDVDKSVEWEYTINSLAETTVESSDGSVHVKLKEGSTTCKKKYDISVDCEDKKVGVCDDDTPGFLQDKIVGISPIYVQPVCSSNGVVQIGINPDKLDIKDEKVSVVQGCEPKYLYNAIDVKSSYIEMKLDQNNCVLVIKDKEMKQKPIIKVRLEATSDYSQIVRKPWTQDTDKGYVLAKNWDEFGWDRCIPSSYTMDFSIGEAKGTGITNGFDNATWFVVVPLDWIYRVSFGWTLEISSWVIAYRTYVFHLNRWGQPAICLESRGWGGNGTLDKIPSEEKYEWYKTYWAPHFYTVTSQNWHLQSLGKYQARNSFAGSTLVECRTGDRFWLAVKISTSLDDDAYDYNQDAHFQIQARSSQWPGGWDEGAYITLEYVAPLSTY